MGRAGLGFRLLFILVGSSQLAWGEPVVIDCGNTAFFSSLLAGKPVIEYGNLGGIDAAYPGDAAQLLISSGAAGKKYYGAPDAVALVVQTSGVPLKVTIHYSAYRYGTRRLEVLWDKTTQQVIDCYTAIEKSEARVVEFMLTEAQTAAGQHVLELAERSDVDGSYAMIDAITIDGDTGLRVITSSGRGLRPGMRNFTVSKKTPKSLSPLQLEKSGALLRSEFGAQDTANFAPGWQAVGSDGGTACLWKGALYVPTPPNLVHTLALPVRGTSGTFGLRQDIKFPEAGSLIVDLKAYPERDSAAILIMCERSDGPEKLYLARFKGQIALSNGQAVWNLTSADEQFHLIRIDFADAKAQVSADGVIKITDVPWPAFDRVSLGHVQPFDGYGIGVAVRYLYLIEKGEAPIRLRLVHPELTVAGMTLNVVMGGKRIKLVTDERGEVCVPLTTETGPGPVSVDQVSGDKAVRFTAVPGDIWVWNLNVELPPKSGSSATTAAAAPTQVWLDCGGQETSVAHGFNLLSEKVGPANTKSAGWLPGTELVAATLPGIDDKLIGDYLDVEELGTTASLQLDLAPGDYSLTMLCASPDLPLGFEVRCEGAPIAVVSQPKTGSWGAYSFPLHCAQRGIRLDFDVVTGLGLAGIVIAPLDPQRPEVRQLEVFRDGLRDKLSVGMAEAQGLTADNPPPDPEPEISPQVMTRGYVCFAHSYMRPVYEGSRPSETEQNVPLTGFGCAGEFEPLTVSIWPLKDLTNAKLMVHDLRHEGGQAVIPASAFDVKAVRIWPQQHGRGTYRMVPELIEGLPKSGLTLPAGKARTFWLTLRVPDDQAPGDYRGYATFTCAGSAIDLPIWFKVLPMQREQIDDLAMGMYWSWLMSADGDLTLTRKQFADMRRHGCNTLCLEAPAPLHKVGTEWVLEVELLDKLLKLCREVGFSQPIPIYGTGWPGTTEAWQAGTRMLLEEGRKRGWPELLFYPVDEPGNNPEALAEAIRLCMAIKQVPGARTYITTNGQGKDAAALDPWLDVRTYQHLSYNPEEARKTIEAGDTLWFYTGPPHGFVYPRLNDGLWWFRSQMTGHFWWHYCWPVGNPWYDFDGSGDWCATYPGPEGPMATVQWECIREGLEDVRYLRTLQVTIAKARAAGKGKAQAEAAEAYLKAICDRIPADGKEIAQALKAIPSEEFQVIRWEVVKKTLALLDTLDGGQRAMLTGNRSFEQTLPQPPYRDE